MSRLLFKLVSVFLFALAAIAVSLRAQERTQIMSPVAEERAHTEPAEPARVIVLRSLRSRAQIHVENMPLSDFAAFLSKQYKIPFKLDALALRRTGIHRGTRISAEIEGVPLSQALQQILGPLNLGHRVVDGTVLITNRPAAPVPVLDDRRAVVNGRIVFFEKQRAGIANAQNVEQRLLQQLRPLLYVELVFLKGTCGLTKDQMRPLREDLERFVKDSAEAFLQLQQGRVPGAGSAVSHAGILLQERLAARVEARFSREMAARYRRELEKRSAYEREARARGLVVFLDRALGLSARQREALNASVLANWDDSWSQVIEMAAQQGQSYVPMIPNELIEPYLEAAQTEIWGNMQKIGSVNWGFQLLQTGPFGIPVPDFDED